MSQFDYPRVNFEGAAFINPGTANNNLLLPLVHYDPLLVKAVLPPRLYCQGDFFTLVKLGVVPLPKGSEIKYNEKEEPYIEIATVNNAESFSTWAESPLGSSPIDVEYHHLYEKAKTERDGQILTGKIPAGWNYYGGMDFGFENVRVCAIETNTEQQGVKKYTSSSLSSPKIVAELLDCEVDLRDSRNRNAAVMIDVIPGISFYSQVFCDSFRLIGKSGLVLQGKPNKASLRFLNTNRVLNLERALGSSGMFYCTIALDDLPENMQQTWREFFENNGGGKNIKGIFIRYNLFEVQENENPDYAQLGTNKNPATAKLMGSISPWYVTEMRSATETRLMLPTTPIYKHKTIGSFAFRYNNVGETLQLDLGGIIPQIKIKKDYITFNLGLLVFTINYNGEPKTIASLTINNDTFNADYVKQTSGLVEIPCKVPSGVDLKVTPISIYKKEHEKPVLLVPENKLMEESEWQVLTDTQGLYINQLDDSNLGYLSYSKEKEACTVKVLRFGKEHAEPVKMTIKCFDLKSSAAAAETFTYLKAKNFVSGTALHFPTDVAANRMYVFYPDTISEKLMPPIPQIIRTGFFVNLRVLPSQDYDKYLNPKHPDYVTPVPFELVYKELLEVSHVIYPWSSIITPFTESYFTKGWPFIKSRLNPDNWDSYTYMPSTRDMSENVYKLICKWAVSQGLE